MNNCPRNILSYTDGQIFTGREIKEWIIYHIEHKTSKTIIATYMTKYLNISDDEFYKIIINRAQAIIDLSL